MLKLLLQFLKGKKEFSFNKNYLLVLKLCCIIHSFLVIVFFTLHVWILFLFNIGSAVLYYFLVKTVTKDRYMITFFLAYIEIVIHTILCVILIGSDMGFQLYIPAVIPLLFFIVFSLEQHDRMVAPLLYSLVSLVLFTAAGVYNYYYAPVYPDITKTAKVFLFLLNSIIVFSILIISSLLFILQIQSSMAEIEAQRQKLSEAASIDPLTGLLNRRKFMEEVKRIIKSNKNFCILLSDIDDFKKVNDTYGHDCGDQVLIHITNQFKTLVNKPDIVCRWGGEEIIVLYSGSFSEGIAFGNVLRSTIETSFVDYNEKKLFNTITTGVAYFDGRESLDSVIIRADKALYKGKQNGKNQVQTL